MPVNIIECYYTLFDIYDVDIYNGVRDSAVTPTGASADTFSIVMEEVFFYETISLNCWADWYFVKP